MKRIVLAAAVGIGLSMGFAVPAHADGVWVAIAWSPSKDISRTSYNVATQALAEQDALQDCNAQGGNDCKVIISSQHCVAMTDDGGKVYAGEGTTVQAAINDALSRAAAGGQGRGTPWAAS